jgi:hypothetical protein
VLDDLVESDFYQIGDEQKEPTELCTETTLRQIKLPNIGRFGSLRTTTSWSLIVCPPWQPCKALLLEDHRDGRRRQLLAGRTQLFADVVDGQILLAQLDDFLSEAVFFWSDTRASFLRGQEELSLRVCSELVAHDAEGARRVSEAGCGFGRGEALDEEGTEGFVLSVGRVGRLEEDVSHICYFLW